ncbi:hypothetical protein [Microbulbifer sp. JSM ZJ756]|uniref:hypothetical protein n=1 Tax=Microbulbifer sp. JSM ZJ756 TaxID=3376191 RepID=UPI0037A86673
MSRSAMTRALLVSLLACPLALADHATATGSVHIALRLPVSVEFDAPDLQSPRPRVCIRRVPARHYSVLVGSGADWSSAIAHRQLEEGCIPAPVGKHSVLSGRQDDGILAITVAAE